MRARSQKCCTGQRSNDITLIEFFPKGQLLRPCIITLAKLSYHLLFKATMDVCSPMELLEVVKPIQWLGLLRSQELCT